jgi:hypothetical protein
MAPEAPGMHKLFTLGQGMSADAVVGALVSSVILKT